MMNENLQFLNSHASVRQFTDQAISPDEEATILYTAQRSPTSSNVQAYSIISVRQDETKTKLAELCGGQQHVSDCSLFLIFCADLYRLAGLNKKRGYPFESGFAEQFIIATVDATLVASRALQAAQALGLGGVMVGGIRNKIEEVSDLIDLPKMVYPVMGLSLGQPIRPATVKPRLPLSAISFSERYDKSVLERSVAEYDRTITELGYLKGREVHPERYPNFDGDYSWSEHTARRMADVDGPTMRPHMLSYLQARGFLTR